MRTFDLSTPVIELENYLAASGWLDPEEYLVAIEKPGEGNMNVVLRIKTNERTFILKQSRPYVQKYQQIEAPLERIRVEKQFYQAIQGNALNAHIPKILGFDTAQNVLLLEDLGHCEDMTVIYHDRTITAKQLERLVFFIGLIHRKKVTDDFPQNLEMRRLNHEHIFVLPFLKDNGFSLDSIQPGLQALAEPYKSDDTLKAIINTIGEKYLSEGDTLLHGDYYPGSWMMEAKNLYIIDPEFAFVGFAEFDLGVMAAHLILATGKKDYMNKILLDYDGTIDEKLMANVAGIEIMRRLIGLAQLAIVRTLDEKRYLLQTAHEMIIS